LGYRTKAQRGSSDVFNFNPHGGMKSNPSNDPAAAAETASKQHVPERQLRNYKRLAEIDLIQAAQIAAILKRNGENEIEAVRSTYTLLDIFLHCQDALKDEASVEAGIKNYQDGVRKDDEFYAALEKAALEKAPHNVGRELNIEDRLLGKHDEDERGADGKRKLVDFKELEAAIYLPPSTRDKPAVRTARLRRFIKEMVLPKTHPELNEHEQTIEAIEQVERMVREGVQRNFLAWIKVKFAEWWEETQARDDSVNGRLGKAVKKRNRRLQVKSGRDKRKGARPKEKEFAEITKIPEEELQELREAIRSDTVALRTVDATRPA
jgi:hypothetical protein